LSHSGAINELKLVIESIRAFRPIRSNRCCRI
jgi:hypothetical protein